MELIRAMEAFPDFQPLLPAFFSDNEYLVSKRKLVFRSYIPGKVRVMRWLNMAIARRSMGDQHDLFHPTYFHPYFLKGLRRPFVVTVHDMIHELFPSSDVRDDGTRWRKRELCRRAARVIAVSASTKSDLCRAMDVPDDKVTVVHHATNLSYGGEPRLHGRRYLLYVGERSGYKNFSFFLNSVSRLLVEADLDLVCAGGPLFDQVEKEQAVRLGVEQRVFHVSFRRSQDLAALYHFAEALCLPSLHEGFGIPLLEAFACACPVVSSSSAALPEIAGEAAEYFCPIFADSIRVAVERALEPRRARELVQLGSARLARYSWLRAAAETLAVYRAAV